VSSIAKKTVEKRVDGIITILHTVKYKGQSKGGRGFLRKLISPFILTFKI
jgi:hypothetical protein